MLVIHIAPSPIEFITNLWLYKPEIIPNTFFWLILFDKSTIGNESLIVIWSLFLLLLTGLLGITSTGDAFNLYVLMEVAALSSYGLLSLGRGRAFFATFNYLIKKLRNICFITTFFSFLIFLPRNLPLPFIRFFKTRILRFILV